MTKIKFMEWDIKKAEDWYQQELINPVNSENMFKAAVYSILSIAQNYTRQKSIYDSLLENNLDTPEKINDNTEGFERIISKARYPNSKIRTIYKLAIDWNWTPNVIIAKEQIFWDIKNGRKGDEFELRNTLAKRIYGVGLKCASLLMMKCGYQNVVPIDRWMIRFLRQTCDYDIRHIESRRGMSKSKYLNCEKEFQKQAELYGYTPAFLQNLVWTYFSKNHVKKENPKQLRLFE